MSNGMGASKAQVDVEIFGAIWSITCIFSGSFFLLSVMMGNMLELSEFSHDLDDLIRHKSIFLNWPNSRGEKDEFSSCSEDVDESSDRFRRLCEFSLHKGGSFFSLKFLFDTKDKLLIYLKNYEKD